MGRHPEVKWAQRPDKVFLTVELPDTKSPQVKIEPEGRFTFSAVVGSSDGEYELDFELSENVNVEESKISVGLRNVFCVLKKTNVGWWKRLLKGEDKPPPYLKVDWNKWVDQDEETEGTKLDNFDLGGMNDLSNFNTDEADSDDEDTQDMNGMDESEK